MKSILFFACCILIFSSCIKEQPKVAWLRIDEWKLESNPNAKMPQGELTHNFSQVFLNMDGKSLGVFELPAKIPIITHSGKHDFVIIPGVKNNGISNTKKRYPFAEQYVETLTLIQDDTVLITPRTRYYANLNFLIEDFESPSLQIDVSEESSGTVARKNDSEILMWGNNYGAILLNNTDSLVSFMTTFTKVLPKLGAEVYLEFDYMNTNSSLISVISYGNDNLFVDPYLIIPPQTKAPVWKHAYIDLKENISYRVEAPINEVQFQFALDEKETHKYFYIDNIKLIYP